MTQGGLAASAWHDPTAGKGIRGGDVMEGREESKAAAASVGAAPHLGC